MAYQDPRFDKKGYWERRSSGLPGQGWTMPKRGYVSGHSSGGPSTKPVSVKAMRKNTKRARKALKLEGGLHA